MRFPKRTPWAGTGATSMALAAVLALWLSPVAARAGSRPPAVLRVGTWHGIPGQFDDIQAAVDAARPGDWILVAPGDYHADVLIRTPWIHLRGMNRSGVVVDGTRAGAPGACAPQEQWQGLAGRNGIEVYKADGVFVQNLTVCNFLTNRSGRNGNEIWWNGGDGSGKTGMGPWWGSYLTATTTYSHGGLDPQGQYGIFVSNARGPGSLVQTYASNMADSGYYVGACPDCNAVIDHGHAENNSIGFSGTNAGGHLLIERSTWDHNKAGIVPNVLNNDDAPPPQNGACPGVPGAASRPVYSGPQARRCTVITGNDVFDNNNPNTPGSGIAGAAPVGTGIELVGTENVAVHDNRVHDNGAWGIVVHDFPDTETPPPVSHCQGGVDVPGTVCYFQAYGNAILHNSLAHNGYFGNPTNGDLALDTTWHDPGNCFAGNTDPAGVTSDPPMLQGPPWSTCGAPNSGENGGLTAELVCDSGLLGSCPSMRGVNYPARTGTTLLPLPAGLASMPDPCVDVPADAWCPGP